MKTLILTNDEADALQGFFDCVMSQSVVDDALEFMTSPALEAAFETLQDKVDAL